MGDKLVIVSGLIVGRRGKNGAFKCEDHLPEWDWAGLEGRQVGGVRKKVSFVGQ